jgi:hypothetical protein
MLPANGHFTEFELVVKIEALFSCVNNPMRQDVSQTEARQKAFNYSLAIRLRPFDLTTSDM